MNSHFRNNTALSKNISEKINPIVKPISDHFGVHTFGYRKFFLDGHSFGMSNNFPWTTFCLENFDKKIIPNYENEIKAVLNEEKFHFFRIEKPENTNLFLSALYEFDIWNTCSLYKKTGDGVEAFYFASTRKDGSIIGKYTNNMDLFERFSYYFKNKLFDIISPQDIRSCASPTISPKIFETSLQNSLYQDQNIKDFISMTPINKFFLNVEGKDVILTFQEFKCLALLSKGKTAKEIGYCLKISPRTVEDYIENIKRKVKLNSRSRLIDLFFLNFHHDKNILKYLAT